MHEIDLEQVRLVIQQKTGLWLKDIDLAVWKLNNTIGEKQTNKILQECITTQNIHEDLLDACVVSETWFFRDFNVVYNAFNTYRASHDEPHVKIACIGSAYGQEAYSVAMFLDNLGIEYEVIGIDLNPKAVRFAQNGVYHIEEMYDIPGEYYHYISVDYDHDIITISKDIKEHVKFYQGNILDSKFMSQFFDQCDMILFRNTLMYMLPIKAFDAIENVEKLRKNADSPIILSPIEVLSLHDKLISGSFTY